MRGEVLAVARYIVHVKEMCYHRYEIEAESEEEALDDWATGVYVGWEWGLGDYEATDVEKMEE